MTRLLDRYVFRELTPPFLLGVGLFTFFLTIDRIYQLTDLVVTQGVPFPFHPSCWPPGHPFGP